MEHTERLKSSSKKHTSRGPEMNGRVSSSRLGTSTLHKSTMNGSVNPRSLVDTTTALRKAKVAEFENSTIVKQRHELNLMVEELKDRDNELNRMVEAHQKQMVAWEKDRRTILSLDEKVSSLQAEIQMKNDDMRAQTSKLRVCEAEVTQRTTALSNAQLQLAELSETQSAHLLRMDEFQSQIDELSEQNTYLQMEIKDMEDRNQHLCHTVKDLNKNIGQLEAREQELLTLLKLKDKDLSESSKHIAELTAKLKRVEVALESSRLNEADQRRNASDWKNKYTHSWKEYEHYKREFQKADMQCEDQNTDLVKLKQECATLRKELTLSVEREKRTDQLLEMQKNKQDRNDRELQNMRDLYAQQEREIALLKLNLEGTKEVMEKQQQRYLSKGFDVKSGELTRSRSPVKYSALNSTLPADFSSRSKSPRKVDFVRSRSPERNDHSRTKLKSTSPSRLAEYSYSRTPDILSRSIDRSPLRNMSPARLRSPERRRSPERFGSPDRSLRMSYTAEPKFELYGSSPSRAAHSHSPPRYYGTSSYTIKEKPDSDYRKQKERDEEELDEDSDLSLPYKRYSSSRVEDKTEYTIPEWTSTKDLTTAADLLVEKYYPRQDPDISAIKLPLDESGGKAEKENGGLNDSNVSGGDVTNQEQDDKTYAEVVADNAHITEDDKSRHSDTNENAEDNRLMSRNDDAASLKSSHSNNALALNDAPKSATNSVHSIASSIHSTHSNMEKPPSVHSEHNSVHSLHSNRDQAQSVHNNHNSVHSLHSKTNSIDSIHSLVESVKSADDKPDKANDNKSNNSESSFKLEGETYSSDSFLSEVSEHTPRGGNGDLDLASRDVPLTLTGDDQASAQSTPRSEPANRSNGNKLNDGKATGDTASQAKSPALKHDELDDMFSNNTKSSKPKMSRTEAVSDAENKSDVESLIGSMNGSLMDTH